MAGLRPISVLDTRKHRVRSSYLDALLSRTAPEAAMDGTFHPASCGDIPGCEGAYPVRPDPLIQTAPWGDSVPASELCRCRGRTRFPLAACRRLRFRSWH